MDSTIARQPQYAPERIVAGQARRRSTASPSGDPRRHGPRYALLAIYDPARSPAWRWGRALRHVVDDLRFSTNRDDEATGRAVRFRRALTGCRTRRQWSGLRRRDPALYAAYELFKATSRMRTEVEARLLAGQNAREIAVITGLSEDVIKVYEETFFHITDRLKAQDWVMAVAIGVGPSEAMTTTAFARYIKAAAYCNGPVVLDALLSTIVADDGSFTLAKLTDWSTPEGQLAARLALSVITEFAHLSPALIAELGRIRDLIERFERRSGTLPLDYIPSEHVALSLTASSAHSATRSAPSLDDAAVSKRIDERNGRTLLVA